MTGYRPYSGYGHSEEDRAHWNRLKAEVRAYQAPSAAPLAADRPINRLPATDAIEVPANRPVAPLPDFKNMAANDDQSPLPEDPGVDIP